jgi:peptide/nickel transport system permease protein
MSVAIERTPVSLFRRTLERSRRDPQLAVSIAMILAWIAAIAGAGVLATANPLAQDIANRLQPPSLAHLFGTDQLGRDVFSRVLHGGRESLPAAIAVVVMGASFGTAVGCLAGYGGRVIDEIAMRVTDMFLAFPLLVLAMAVAAALGPSLADGVLALTAVWWPQYVRVSRGLVLDLREREYVTASEASGRKTGAILFRVVLPNVLPVLSVMAAIDVGRAILAFSILSFLGLGERPPAPEWGSMVASGAGVMDQWWVATFPGLAILSLVFAFNLLGDSLGDAMDPWLQGRR